MGTTKSEAERMAHRVAEREARRTGAMFLATFEPGPVGMEGVGWEAAMEHVRRAAVAATERTTGSACPCCGCWNDQPSLCAECWANQRDEKPCDHARTVQRPGYVRQLEDACLVLWAELPPEQTKELRAEAPVLADFLAHLHHSVEHEQAMVRQNVWADRGVCPACNGIGTEAERPFHTCRVCDGEGVVPAGLADDLAAYWQRCADGDV